LHTSQDLTYRHRTFWPEHFDRQFDDPKGPIRKMQPCSGRNRGAIADVAGNLKIKSLRFPMMRERY